MFIIFVNYQVVNVYLCLFYSVKWSNYLVKTLSFTLYFTTTPPIGGSKVKSKEGESMRGGDG